MQPPKLPLFLFIIIVTPACSTTLQLPAQTASPSPTSLFTIPTPASGLNTAIAASPTQLQTRASFRVTAIVDTISEPVSLGQVQAVMNDANKNFLELTGFALELSDFEPDGLGGSTTEMVNRYVQSHANGLPSGIVVFSYGDNGQAKLYGGYSYTVPGPAGFRNHFVSPMMGGDQIYIAVVDFSYRYAACGYGGADTLKSKISIGAECSNHRGTACVPYNGYSMCSNAAGDLYSSTPTYFAASTLIHEFMHPFSPDGEKDHYATPQCNTKMGWPQGFYDNIEAEYHNGLCPFVYDDFVKSYQP